MRNVKSIRRNQRMLLLALFGLLFFGAAAVMAEEVPRLNVTTQGLKSTVDKGQGTTSHDEFAPLAESGTRENKTRSVTQSKVSVTESSSPNTDFWFYTADVELFSDQDRDGYYYGVDLLFDADTSYTVADVYAVVYLSLDGGPWEEYAETDYFTLYGASADDEYVIVTELISGYPTGSYDILIELFDALDDSFVADIGPLDTSELSLLPLEDADRDAPVTSHTTVVVSEGGGSFGLLMLFGLILVSVRQFQA